MKKKVALLTKVAILSAMLISLASCQGKNLPAPSTGSTSKTNPTTVVTPNTTSTTVIPSTTNGNTTPNTTSTTIIPSTTNGNTQTTTTTTTIIDPSITYGVVDVDTLIPTDLTFSTDAHLSANHAAFSGAKFNKGSYAVSYDTSTNTSGSGINFLCYRYGKSGNYLVLNQSESKYDDTLYHGLEGSVFNSTPIGGINQIEIEYKTDKNTQDALIKPNIRFGYDDNCDDYVYFLEPSTSLTTKLVNVNLSHYQYFSINSGDYTFYLNNLSLDYDNETKISPVYEETSGEGKCRINPITYTYSLVAGESKITAPTSYTYDEATNTYTVATTKEFTYYDLNYVRNHPEVKEAATITDPLEVCIYYSLFKRWPANYSKNTNQVNSIFGSDARKVSEYSRTDGYCRAIPWNGNGVYYELDIDVDGSYRTSSRGVGRVVVWEKGWSEEGYDNSPVCIYTDDHYNTFMEYLNNGTWSQRFNAEGLISKISYSSAKTVTLSGFDPNMVAPTSNPSGGGSTDTPTEKLIDDKDYYGNYAPLEIINSKTACFQKVTCMDGIKVGAEYIIVNEDYEKCDGNGDNLIYDYLNHKASLNTSQSWNKYEDTVRIKFEDAGNGYYYVSICYSGVNWCDFTNGACKVSFDEYGNIVIIDYNNKAYRFNPANSGIFSWYNTSSQNPVQIYRYCDIEGATPEASKYAYVNSFEDFSANYSYLIVSYPSCVDIYGANYAGYSIDDTNKKLTVQEEGFTFQVRFAKHPNYDNVYAIYNEAYSTSYIGYDENTNSIIPLEDPYCFYVSFGENGLELSPAKTVDKNLVSSNTYLSYDVTAQGFVLVEQLDSTSKLYLYKIADTEAYAKEIEIDNSVPANLVKSVDALNEEDTFILYDTTNDKCFGNLNLAYNYNSIKETLKVTDEHFTALHFEKYTNQWDNVWFAIYTVDMGNKLYLTYDKNTKICSLSSTPETYFVIEISSSDGNVKLRAEKVEDGNNYSSPIFDDQSWWYLKYDSEKSDFVFLNSQDALVNNTNEQKIFVMPKQTEE